MVVGLLSAYKMAAFCKNSGRSGEPGRFGGSIAYYQTFPYFKGLAGNRINFEAGRKAGSFDPLSVEGGISEGKQAASEPVGPKKKRAENSICRRESKAS